MGLTQERFSRVPVDAGIGDGLAADELVERLREFLAAADEITFEHGSDDGFRFPRPTFNGAWIPGGQSNTHGGCVGSSRCSGGG